jgi:hypothetical protein
MYWGLNQFYLYRLNSDRNLRDSIRKPLIRRPGLSNNELDIFPAAVHSSCPAVNMRCLNHFRSRPPLPDRRF